MCQPRRVAGAARRPGARRPPPSAWGGMALSGVVVAAVRSRDHCPPRRRACHRGGGRRRPRPGPAAHPAAAGLPALRRARRRAVRPVPAEPARPALARPGLPAVGRRLRGRARATTGPGGPAWPETVRTGKSSGSHEAGPGDPYWQPLHDRAAGAGPAVGGRGRAASSRCPPARAPSSTSAAATAGTPRAVPALPDADRDRARPAGQRRGRPGADRRRGPGRPGAVPRRRRDHGGPAADGLRRGAVLQPRAPPGARGQPPPCSAGSATRSSRAAPWPCSTSSPSQAAAPVPTPTCWPCSSTSARAPACTRRGELGGWLRDAGFAAAAEDQDPAHARPDPPGREKPRTTRTSRATPPPRLP